MGRQRKLAARMVREGVSQVPPTVFQALVAGFSEDLLRFHRYSPTVPSLSSLEVAR